MGAPPKKKKHARHWPLIVFHQPLRSPHAEKVTENNGNDSPRLVGGSSHAEEIWYNQIRSSSPALYNHCVGIPGSIPSLVGNPDVNLHFWLESWVGVRSKLVNTPCVGNHHPHHFQTWDKLSKLDLASNPRKLRSLRHSFMLPGSDHPKYLDPRSPWPPFLIAWFTGFTIYLRKGLTSTTRNHQFYNGATSELPKLLRTWGVLHILTCKCASRHSGVPFFISRLNGYLRTRRFGEPTFQTSGSLKKHSDSRLS